MPLSSAPIARAGFFFGPTADRLGFFVLFLWAFFAWNFYAGSWGDDLAALWFAAHLHATGQDSLIYAAPETFFGGTPSEWQPLLDSVRTTGREKAYPYIYPPLWAGLVAPLAKTLSPWAFQKVFLTLHVGLLVISSLLAESIARPDWMPRLVFRLWIVAILMFSAPATALLWLNQPTTIVNFLILLSVAVSLRRPIIAGAALAVATAIKITPFVFALQFFQRPRGTGGGTRRILFSFALCGLALGVLSVATMGWPLHYAFLEQLKLAASKAVWALMNPSPRLLVLDLANQLPQGPELTAIGHRRQIVTEIPRWAAPLGEAMFFGICALTLRLSLYRHGPQARTLTVLSLSIALFLFGPVSWLHYLVLPLMLAPALGAGMSRTGLTTILALLFIGSSMTLAKSFVRLGAELMPYTLMISALWAIALAATLIALARQPRH